MGEEEDQRMKPLLLTLSTLLMICNTTFAQENIELLDRIEEIEEVTISKTELKLLKTNAELFHQMLEKQLEEEEKEEETSLTYFTSTTQTPQDLKVTAGLNNIMEPPLKKRNLGLRIAAHVIFWTGLAGFSSSMIGVTLAKKDLENL